jgi:hypothetical protein
MTRGQDTLKVTYLTLYSVGLARAASEAERPTTAYVKSYARSHNSPSGLLKFNKVARHNLHH